MQAHKGDDDLVQNSESRTVAAHHHQKAPTGYPAGALHWWA